MHAQAREILLLAAEDAFEFERLREAGPLSADVDPEATAAEIAEFEALGIPMPDELDSLRRELDHAPKVREAIRASALALRRSGGASASALVALGPQHLVGAGAWGAAGPGMAAGPAAGMDPRLLAMMDPRFAAMLDPRMAAAQPAAASVEARVEAPVIETIPVVDPRAKIEEPRRARADDRERDRDRDGRRRESSRRERKLATAAVIGSDGPVDAEVLRARPDDLDDDWDDDDDERDDDDRDDDERDDLETERPRGGRARPPRERPRPKRARAARPREDDWDDDDDSLVVARAPQQDNKATWILGGISAVAVIALLWMAFGNQSSPPSQPALDPAAQAQLQQPQQQQQALPQPQPAPAIDPALAAAPVPAEVAPPAPQPAPSSSGSRGSGVSGSSRSSGGSSGGGSSGSVNPFGTYTPPGKDVVGGGGQTPPAQPTDGGQAGGGAVAPAAGGTPPAEQPKPAEEAKPAEAPPPAEPPPEPELTKSKMTPAIRDAITGKVGVLQQCYTDALVGKPDLQGRVVFTISLDQDGVVKKVDIGKDEVKYGVAKCAAKKIRTWTLPSAGIPIIFDLPFDFKQ